MMLFTEMVNIIGWEEKVMILCEHARFAGFAFPGQCGRRCTRDELLCLEFGKRIQVGLERHLCKDINSDHEIEKTFQEEVDKMIGSV